MKLLIIWTGLCYDFYFSFLDFEDKRAFWDWHYFSYLISANEVFGVTLRVIWEYLEVCVPLLKPELVVLVRLAELKPRIMSCYTFFGYLVFLFAGKPLGLDLFSLGVEGGFVGKWFVLFCFISQFHEAGIKNKFNCISFCSVLNMFFEHSDLWLGRFLNTEI